MKERVLAAGNVYNKELTQHMMKLFGSQMKSGVKDKISSFLDLPRRVFQKIVR
jgi:hypothetical protein